MTDDLAQRIQRQQAALRDGDIETADFARFLARMRAQFGEQQVDAVLQVEAATTAGGTTQVVTESARVGVAVAGSLYGDVFINGQWTRDESALLHQYLEHLIARCAMLPLQGIREQKSSTDLLAIKLDQVYTQLATAGMVQREVFDRASLAQFDASAYLAAHRGTELLPAQQRSRVRVAGQAGADRRPISIVAGGRTLLSGVIDANSDFYSEQDLVQWTPQELAAATQQGDELIFYGPQLVTEAIADSSHIVVLGEPGSGKSTLLRYLALTLAEAGLDEHVDLQERLQGWSRLGAHYRPLPIYYPLLTFAQRLAKDPGLAGTAHDLWNALADFIDPATSSTGLATVVRDRINRGAVILLLDGLDEVATVESRRKVVQAVAQFATEHPLCRIIVTCRVRAYEGERNAAWQLPGWPTVTLADWTRGQMAHFIAAWYHEAARANDRTAEWRGERVTALQTALGRRPDLQRLGVRPLLLTIMAVVHFNDGRLPEDSVSLYHRCIEILLGQWELGRADGTAYGTLMAYISLPNSGVEAFRPLLEVAAFRAHEAQRGTDQGSLGCEQLRLLVMDALKERGHTNPYDGAEKFLDYTDKRAGLLQASDAGDAYVFPHLTFQEYLAGVHLVSGLHVVDKIMARRNDDRWRVPIMLGVGDHVSGNKLEMPYRLFQELLTCEERSVEQTERDLLFAADLGQELGWDRLEQGDTAFKRVRRDLAQQLGSVVEGRVLPATERVRAGSLLGTLGDPRPGVCALPPSLITIGGGAFVIGLTAQEVGRLPKDEQPYYSHVVNDQPVSVRSFALAKYPVTNGQFKLFMDDAGYDRVVPWWEGRGREWLDAQDNRRAPNYWGDERWGMARANHPVVGVSWYEAQAFCRWLTQQRRYNPVGIVYRLPTEAEWEWAARGVERRMYAWGWEEPDGDRANYDGTYNGMTAVGCFPGGGTPEGVLDLAGNVLEWTGSVYGPYPYDADDGREQPTEVARKRFTLRGGSWNFNPIFLRAANRDFGSPDDRIGNVGFRLATHLPV
ncbi:MAG: SUMF1/EgtB/PvdO family nonheme iron enzyme [Herpetosiphonaceae bacterium]|nr:SUMF1/EgtB/PvdO family nonheme iron enzyme [Herpetosiphonaceae bacterium]